MSSKMPPSQLPTMLGKRVSKPPARFGVSATEDQLQEMDQGIDSLVTEGEVDDDFDWLPVVPGRPSPYSTTWNTTYANRVKVDGANGVFWRVQCDEGCGKPIDMDGKFQEINGASTPKGKLRKPPVCHIVPWALLKARLDEMEQEEKHQGRGRTLTDAFKKKVCWGMGNNLRPGHNGCNAGGTKETAESYKNSADARGRAKAVVQSCMNAGAPPAVWNDDDAKMPISSSSPTQLSQSTSSSMKLVQKPVFGNKK